MPQYRVLPNKQFGLYQSGAVVEEDEQAAAPYVGRVLEAVTDATGKPTDNKPTAANVEKQLEAETGHDVVKTGDEPPTFVETGKPAPGTRKK